MITFFSQPRDKTVKFKNQKAKTEFDDIFLKELSNQSKGIASLKNKTEEFTKFSYKDYFVHIFIPKTSDVYYLYIEKDNKEVQFPWSFNLDMLTRFLDNLTEQERKIKK